MTIPEPPRPWKKKLEVDVVQLFAESGTGRTPNDAKEIARQNGGYPSDSSIDHSLPDLIKDGILINMNPDPKSKPYRLKPFCEVASAGRSTRKDKLPKELAKLELVKLAHARAMAIIEHISEGESWLKPRRIKSICRNEIGPFLQTICLLRRAGYSLPFPEEYEPFFDPDLKAYWRGILGGRDMSGTISVYNIKCPTGAPLSAILTSNGWKTYDPLAIALLLDGPKKKWTRQVRFNDPRIPRFVNPSLIEWRQYLEHVVAILKEEIDKG